MDVSQRGSVRRGDVAQAGVVFGRGSIWLGGFGGFVAAVLWLAWWLWIWVEVGRWWSRVGPRAVTARAPVRGGHWLVVDGRANGGGALATSMIHLS